MPKFRFAKHYLPRRSTCGYINTISTEAANLLWLAIEGAVLDGMQEGGPLMLGFRDLKICFGVSGEPLDIQKWGGVPDLLDDARAQGVPKHPNHRFSAPIG